MFKKILFLMCLDPFSSLLFAGPNEDLWERLRQCKSELKKKEVLNYIQKGVDPNFTRIGVSLLHHAVSNYQTGAVAVLLNAGANVDSIDSMGNSPLHYASQLSIRKGGSQAAYDIMKILINKNADINLKGKSGQTPLHLAAITGYRQPIELLLKCGADANIRDNKGRIALHLAAMSTGYGIDMLARVSDSYARDEDGKTPLHLGAEFGRLNDRFEKLLKYYDLPHRPDEFDMRDNKGRTPLHLAAISLSALYYKLAEFEPSFLNIEDHYGEKPEDILHRLKAGKTDSTSSVEEPKEESPEDSFHRLKAAQIAYASSIIAEKASNLALQASKIFKPSIHEKKWIADFIDNLDPKIKNTDSFISRAPEFLNTCLHPKDSKSLKEKKGVIWVNTIDNARMLKSILQKHGVSSECVYYGKVNSAEIIDDFSNKNRSNLQILIAVQKLTENFDPKILDYIIIAKPIRKFDKFHQMLESIVQKSTEKNKVVYMLTFSEWIHNAQSEVPAEIKSDLKLDTSKTLNKLTKEILDQQENGIQKDNLDVLNIAYRESIRSIHNIQVRNEILPVQIEDVLPDGDCGFHATGISRQEFINSVIRHYEYYTQERTEVTPGRIVFFTLLEDMYREMTNNSGILVYDISTWTSIMKDSKYWLDDEHIRMLSFVSNLRLYLYGIGSGNSLIRRSILTPGVRDEFFERNSDFPNAEVREIHLLHYNYAYNPADPQHRNGNHYARLHINVPTPENTGISEPEQNIDSDKFIDSILNENGFDYQKETYSRILRSIHLIQDTDKLRRVSMGSDNNPYLVFDTMEREDIGAFIQMRWEREYPTDRRLRELYDNMLHNDGVSDINSWRTLFESSEFEIGQHHLEFMSYLFNFHFHVYQVNEDGVLVPLSETYLENTVNRKRKTPTKIHLLNIPLEGGRQHFVRVYPQDPYEEGEHERTFITPLRETYPNMTLAMILSLFYLTNKSN